MKFITRKLHIVLDYTYAIALIASPWLLGFQHIQMAAAMAVLGGVMVLLLSILTDYEGGLIRLFSFPLHLTMDIALGAILAASPLMFGFSDKIYIPHLLFGLFAIFASLLTSRVSPKYNHLT